MAGTVLQAHDFAFVELNEVRVPNAATARLRVLTGLVSERVSVLLALRRCGSRDHMRFVRRMCQLACEVPRGCAWAVETL